MSVSARHVVGCMTGTSIDAIDVALVRVHGRGLEMRAEFVRGASRALGELGTKLRAMAGQRPMTAEEIAGLSREFAVLHAAVVREVMGAGAGSAGLGEPGHSDRPDLVAVHGQTVFHSPPLSWQMFNGPVLAHELSARVVFDLRAADLAAGGQGAPITPLADWIFFRSSKRTAVVNLGGFCNATLLPGDDGRDAAAQIPEIQGFDVCACNHLLDRIARELMGRAYDQDGSAATGGVVRTDAKTDLAGVLERQSRGGRSLGTGDEAGRWIERWRSGESPSDLAATACAAIGATIAARVGGSEHVLLAGGGTQNRALRRAIESSCGVGVEDTSSRGVPIEFREAAEMAVLGALCEDRVPITLARVTGVRGEPPVAGVWA